VAEALSRPQRRAPSPATTAALVLAGAVVTALLTAYALRGGAPRTHVVIALGLPVFLGLLFFCVVARARLARLPVRWLLAAGLILLPCLAVLGPALALPPLRPLFGFRVVLAAVGLGGLLWLIAVRRRWRLEGATYVVLFAAWVCWLLITLAWAPDPGAGPHYLLLLIGLGAVAAATASAGLSERRLRWLLLGLAAVYGLSLLVGLAETRLHVHLPTASHVYSGKATPAAFFYNTNDFATYLALCWPFVLLLPSYRRRGGTLALVALALLATAGVLLYTGARVSVLAIALETVIVAVVIALRAGRWGRIAVAVLAVVALLGMGLLLAGVGGRFGAAFSVSKLAGQVHSGSGSGAVRSELQTAGLRAASTRWFLGVGPGNAESVVARQNPGFTVLNLHNWWLEVFVDGGLPALLIFLTLYLTLLAAMVRVARHTGDRLLRYLGLATAVALAGFSVAIIGPSTAVQFPPMAILFGLAVAVILRARRSDELLVPVTQRHDAPASGGAGLLDSEADEAGGHKGRAAPRRPARRGDAAAGGNP